MKQPWRLPSLLGCDELTTASARPLRTTGTNATGPLSFTDHTWRPTLYIHVLSHHSRTTCGEYDWRRWRPLPPILSACNRISHRAHRVLPLPMGLFSSLLL
jgi:hypothetical protein